MNISPTELPFPSPMPVETQLQISYSIVMASIKQEQQALQAIPRPSDHEERHYRHLRAKAEADLICVIKARDTLRELQQQHDEKQRTLLSTFRYSDNRMSWHMDPYTRSAGYESLENLQALTDLGAEIDALDGKIRELKEEAGRLVARIRRDYSDQGGF